MTLVDTSPKLRDEEGTQIQLSIDLLSEPYITYILLSRTFTMLSSNVFYTCMIHVKNTCLPLFRSFDMSRGSIDDIVTYSDTDWAGSKDTCHSTSRIDPSVLVLQATVSRFSAEAEYLVIANPSLNHVGCAYFILSCIWKPNVLLLFSSTMRAQFTRSHTCVDDQPV
ncbi:hypothetical protein V2J09_017730 [Rumex salicifolius]